MQDFDQQLQLAQQRRQQFAGQRDFQAPQGKMVGRHFVAPNALEHLAAGLRSFNGIRGQDMAEQEMKELQGGKQKAIAEALRNFGEMSQGRPADVLPPEQAGPVRPAQAPDTMGAYQALMQAPDAALRQSGMQGIIQMPQLAAQQQERIDARDFRREEAQATRAARAEELQIKMQDARASQQERLQAQKELREMQIDAQREMRQLVASNRPERQAQIIQTESGPMQLVNGQAVPITGPDGKPISGKPAAATGVTPATKTQDARDALATIDMAEKLIGQATGSGIGSATDATAAFFGLSTKGAQAGAQLKALEGDLVAKMPKMSGPQSDKDVLLYRQMAGQIGDPGVPQATKRAALKSIREMQNRYAAGGAQGGATGTFEKPANSIDSLLDKYK